MLSASCRLVLAAAALMAGQAAPALNVFTPGTPALASEVNANFAELAARILALETFVVADELDADLLDGLDSSAFLTSTGPFAVNADTAAAATLSVGQAGSGNAIFATTASTDPGEAAVVGRAGAAAAAANAVAGLFGTSAEGRGVVGTSSNNDGVFGYSDSGTGVEGQSASGTGVAGWSGGGTGVEGQSASGNGVEGIAESANGVVYGVRGTSSSNGGGAGVRGEGGWVGVWGESSGRWGVYGRSTGSSNSYGVYGTVGSGTNNYAGYFSGNVNVTGTLSKGGGSFVIDHPLDPANRYLRHSFVESPDMMNVYNGNAVLDDLGEARVELPDYFEALNRDFRYQLTAIGEPAPDLHVAEPVRDNAFRIAGGVAGMTVSWQVTGIRQDAFAVANPIVVEEDKPAAERGTYLYPEGVATATAFGPDTQP